MQPPIAPPAASFYTASVMIRRRSRQPPCRTVSLASAPLAPNMPQTQTGKRMPDFRMIDTGRARLRAAVAGEGPLVVMVHGFPESWYSWRHQIGPIAEAGYQVAALDVRGY